MDIFQESLQFHEEKRGKIEVAPLVPVSNEKELSLAYTPGVSEPCMVISKDVKAVNKYTRRWNLVAIVSDGSAVLGLGDIGPEAGLPVMEGKALLFKAFGGVDAFPLCINTKDVNEIVEFIKRLEPTFAGINLEDISAPRCFEIEERLKKETKMAIFHDDQHGTAIVTMAGLINALKIVNKKIEAIKVITCGAGAAGIAVIKLLMNMGVKNVIMCDRRGAIYEGRQDDMNPIKEEIARITNRDMIKGSLADAFVGADVFIGVSGPGLVTKEMIASMNPGAIVMAMANPTPEIMPDEAKEAGAAIVCTGRSDYPNQVNNVLAFPGLFRGAFDVEASEINEAMKIAAAYAIASQISPEELSPEYVIPKVFNPQVGPAVAKAVAKAAMTSGVAGKQVDPEWVVKHCQEMCTIVK
ncbi:NAD(P)-dependent malic enzyme [Dehalobacterium formicoaceticum]|uniref:NAD-dependent malic enzyme n=1 Tax=Dehalobacterium formicoaceticum TaxID=51515 RepID=A0ABT1Y3Z2_9FIRM|nr:malic enzyme-like NAD(P)-binding protein [Dehalobacterium formicoaceticum]MCR6544406.1 NAD-dependent malic enzyme [Dehalobacterium formicoaceticum]